MFSPLDKYTLNAFWWFWFPLSFAVALAVAEPFLSDFAQQLIYDENGMLEMPQAIVAFSASFISFMSLKYCKGNRWLMIWVGVAALSTFYIGLEEISYGQQLFKWGTPEYWQHVNDQQETNLHNTSHWLDQTPRQILTIGILVGGIVIPFLRRWKPSWLPKQFNIIYPEGAVFWTAFLVIFLRILKVLQKADIITVYHRPSEVQELLLYYFVLIYMMMLRPKLKAAQTKPH